MLPQAQSTLVTNYLLCRLCEQPCLQPRMCPKCTQTFCNHCLLTACNSLRPDCPACSYRLRLDDFLLPETVLAVVERVVEGVRREMKRDESRQMCPDHELPLGYFCVDCNCPLCADCGLLTNKHTSHKIMSYRDIHQRVKARVLEEFPRFDRKLKTLEARKEQMRDSLEVLQEDYRRYKKYFEEAFLGYTQIIETEAERLQGLIAGKQEGNHRRLQELEVLRDGIYEEMETKAQISLIGQASSLVESIGVLACQEPPPPISEGSADIEDLIELVPEYSVWDYSLTEYSKRNGIVYSEEKSMNGVEWRLKVYPHGNGLARQKYISVFVEMTKGLVSQNKYEYRIELVNQARPELSVKREYCSTFQMGECWGYNQFEPLDHLAEKQYLVSDTLHFRIGLRNRTYRSLSSQQQLYISHLNKQLLHPKRQARRTKPQTARSSSPTIRSEVGSSGQKSVNCSTLDLIKEFLDKEARLAPKR